jgi:hypothetical protein
VLPRSPMSLRVTIGVPPYPVAYPVDAVLVQWSSAVDSADPFAGADLAVPESCSAVTDEPVSSPSPAPAPSSSSASLPSNGLNASAATAPFEFLVRVVDARGAPVTPAPLVQVVPIVPGSASHALGSLCVLLPPGAPLDLGCWLQVDVGPLVAGMPYTLRAALNTPWTRGSQWVGVAGGVGPLGVSNPPRLAPLLPVLTRLVTPGRSLPCAGGQAVEVWGQGLGVDPRDSVTLVLTNARGASFQSAPCTLVTLGTTWRCVTPPGVGYGLVSAVSVNGVLSEGLQEDSTGVGLGLSYTPPTIEGLSGPGEPWWTQGKQTIPAHTIPHQPTPHYQYHTTPHDTTPTHATLSHTTLYDTSRHHTTPIQSLHYTTPHFTIPHQPNPIPTLNRSQSLSEGHQLGGGVGDGDPVLSLVVFVFPPCGRCVCVCVCVWLSRSRGHPH